MEHSVGKVFIIILTCVIYVVNLVLNGLSSGVNTDLFQSNQANISDKYSLQITPAGWTFSIWGFIFAWQLLWIIYAIVSIFRKTSDNRYVYQLPVLPVPMYLSFIANTIFVVSWLFLWDREYIDWSLPVIALGPFTLYICLFFVFRNLARNLTLMYKIGLTVDVWLTRILVQNGLAFFAAWVTIATLLNFSITLSYKWGVEESIASTISLSIVSAEILLWFALDNFVLDKYTRYTFSPYITATVAFTGVVTKNYNLDTAYRNSLFSLVLLVVAAVALVAKIIMIIYRHIRYPLKTDTDSGNSYQLA